MYYCLDFSVRLHLFQSTLQRREWQQKSQIFIKIQILVWAILPKISITHYLSTWFSPYIVNFFWCEPSWCFVCTYGSHRFISSKFPQHRRKFLCRSARPSSDIYCRDSKILGCLLSRWSARQDDLSITTVVKHPVCTRIPNFERAARSSRIPLRLCEGGFFQPHPG